MKTKIAHISLIPALLLVLLVQYGQITSKHAHINSKGVVFVHAHLLDFTANNADTATGNHEHSNNELQLLHNFSVDFNPIVISPLQLKVEQAKSGDINIPVEEKLFNRFSSPTLRLRGPPALA